MSNKPTRGTQGGEMPGRLTGIVHDLNNCLTIVRGRAQIALEEPNPNATRESLEQIITAADRALLLAHEVESLARPALLLTAGGCPGG